MDTTRMPEALLVDLRFDGERLVREPARIRLAGGRIAAIDRGIDPGAAAGPGVIDARGKLVMPGLVNAHVHIARAGWFEAEEPPLRLAQIAKNMEGALQAGVTTVADLGCTVPMLGALRTLTADDPFAGPRIIGAGPMLTAPEGYPFDWLSDLWRFAEAAIPMADEDAAARAVGHLARAGVDHVKVAIMHQTFAETPIPAVTTAVAKAMVAEAHQLGRRVLAHAHSNADYRVGLDAGIDALMHSSFEPLDQDVFERIRDRGMPVCPTLWVYESTCFCGSRHHEDDPKLLAHATPGLRRSWRRFADALAASPEVFPPGTSAAGLTRTRGELAIRVAMANLRLLHEAGVPIVFGNDASFGFALLGRPVDELDAMQRSGMDALACLRAATGNAADVLARKDIGRLAVGAMADLIVVDPAVASDVARLDRPELVLVGGRTLPRRTLDDPRRLLALGRAYLSGTAQTLAGTAGRLAKARLARLTRQAQA